jgi:hypothetical protein
MKFFQPFFVFCIACSFSLAKTDDLSVLAAKYGTDKGPVVHNYTPIYNSYFKNIRSECIKFLEIGFFRGASARMWESYFAQAELHFIDVRNHKFKEYGKDLSKRCQFHQVNQENEAQLQAFVKKTGGDFDIIIDDGGHTMKQQLVSFAALFPAVKSGGLYVLEDSHTSYLREFGGHGTHAAPSAKAGSAIDFFKNRIDDVNYIAASTRKASRDNCPKELWNKLTEYQKEIESLHFYSGLVFIFKR